MPISGHGGKSENARTRLVRFEYCISMLFFTLRRESEPAAVTTRRSEVLASLPYCLITFLFGWWGIPWGLLLTPAVIWRNLSGGIPDENCDGTDTQHEPAAH